MQSAHTDIPFCLDEMLVLLRQSIRQFAELNLEPIAAHLDETNQFPRKIWPQLGELGVLGITAEPEYGGTGLGYLAHVIAMEEISRASAAIGLSYGAHSNLCVNQLVRYGTPEQKTLYLPRLISGEHVGALAMTEANAGSDITSMQLKASEEGDYFILEGTKMWITNGPHADVIIVYAKTNPLAGAKGITAFIVEKKFPGFSVGQKIDKLGMRGSDTSELLFKRCVVPKANILGELNQGIHILMEGLDYERLILAAGPIGIMQACLDIVIPYVRTRQQFSKAIGEFELIQAKLADMFTALNTSRAYVYNLAQICDQGGRISRHSAASAILYTAEQATKVADQAIQCLGGNGYSQEYPTGRLSRDAKLYEIGAGTSEIRRVLIGRELFRQN